MQNKQTNKKERTNKHLCYFIQANCLLLAFHLPKNMYISWLVGDLYKFCGHLVKGQGHSDIEWK